MKLKEIRRRARRDKRRGEALQRVEEALTALPEGAAEHIKSIVEHVASPECWRGPAVDYVDPETGAAVWVHKQVQ